MRPLATPQILPPGDAEGAWIDCLAISFAIHFFSFVLHWNFLLDHHRSYFNRELPGDELVRVDDDGLPQTQSTSSMEAQDSEFQCRSDIGRSKIDLTLESGS